MITTEWLEKIQSPADVKQLTLKQQTQLCEELRRVMIDTVSKTGGHLASNLGVVELTVALHSVLDMPRDQIVWDVGHQCYPHKLLTGRWEAFSGLRQENGLSGFPAPEESEYDSFVVGHSSTSVSLANGLAKAKALSGDNGVVAAVIGDGALTGGLAYEGLCNAGRSHDRLIVILNDNRMSIGQNVGFIARYLATLRSRLFYIKAKNRLAKVLRHIPLLGKPLYYLLVKAKLGLKRTMYKSSTMFEEMGFYYLGPIDGHDLTEVAYALETAKSLRQPVLLHVETVKGKGFAPAEKQPDLFHGVGKFDAETGASSSAKTPTFSSVFGETLLALAEQDARICAITAAMKSGTGLADFEKKYAKRCFDVGIAEEHAVTFASGLSKGGSLPVFAVYSTFLQRCYDQLLNDTALNKTHVVLAIDRAGFVPDDGSTHQGLFDVPLLSTVPRTSIYAPATLAELKINLRQAIYDDDGIAAVRYPKGEEHPLAKAYTPDYAPFRLRESAQSDTLLITYGRLYHEAVEAVARLEEQGVAVSLLKLTRIFPVEEACVQMALRYRRVVFFEEGNEAGGIGQQFAALLMKNGFAGNYTLRAVNEIIPACKPASAMRRLGLDANGMIEELAHG